MAKYCQECGKKIDDNQKLCNSCKSARKGKKINLNVLWWILGFVLPPVGLILYFCWKNNEKESAKNAGTGALVGACLYLFFGLSLMISGNGKETKENVLKNLNVASASEKVKEWYGKLEKGELVVTVIGSVNCGYCQQYKPVITKFGEDNNINVYFFEGEELTEEEYNIVESAFNLENYEGSVPYTFIAKDKKFIMDTVGYRDEQGVIDMLESAGVLKN